MGRRVGTYFALGWLLLMIFPFAALVSNPHPATYVAGGAIGGLAFCAVYAWIWLRQVQWQQSPAPAVGLIALTAFALALSLADGPTWGATLIYCTVVAGASFDWRRAIPVVIAYAAVAAGLSVGFDLGGGFALGAFIEISLTGLGTIGIFRLVQANIELRRAREEMSKLAVAEERLRFARDLHDLLGHSLSVIVLKAELAHKLAGRDPVAAAGEMADVERVARQALREVREAVAGYRQASLSQELTGMREVLHSAGIEPRIEKSSGPLPANVESVLAWAVREGVTNVVRDSRARRCTISLSRDEAAARLEILDDGVGADGEAGTGTGLRGLQERVTAQGGEVNIGRRAEGGFRVLVRLPLRELPAPEVVGA
jgi:two-component system, NarL family, sensor histidine kinase DesK